MAKAKYAEGEKILCFHGPLLYEAKCLQVDIKDGQMKYFVHYQGWNKNWDEWVTEARMMKFNAVGLQKQKELKEVFAKPGGKKLRKAELQRQAYPLPESLRHLEERLLMPASAPSQLSAAASAAACSASVSASSTSASAASEAAEPVVGTATATMTAVAELEPVSIASTSSVLENMPELALAMASPQQQQAAQSQSSQARPPATPPPTTLQPGAVPAVVPPIAPVEERQKRRRPAPMPKLRVSLPLSDRLRDWLADDQDLVINQCKLLRLPASPPFTVCAIARDYAESGASANDDSGADHAAAGSARREFAAGLIGLFNSCLGCRLLYKFERPQYAALMRSQKSALPADVYGAAHLLRLMACLPDLLPLAELPAEPAAHLLDDCRRFLAFLDRQVDTYLSVDSYDIASPDYQRLALCI